MKKKKIKKNYNYQSLRDEREYGFYWYSALWRILRPILITVASLLIVVGICFAGWKIVYGKFLAPVNAQDGSEVVFSVAEGSSLSKVSNQLEKQDLIRSRTIFKYYLDFLGLGQKIQVGEYTLSKAMTMNEIADQLTSGDGKPMTRKVTIIPGWSVEEVAAQLVKDGALTSQEEFLNLAKNGANFTEYYYVADVLATPNASQRKYALEGYLSPNTYEVYIDATPQQIITKALSQTEAEFSSEFHQRAEELNMTMDQVITLASLIEKEAKNDDFSKVSAVFHNRLNSNMKLQSDVTVHYVTGIRRMALKNDDLNINSPYNTYQITGLPIGPICSPSAAAIRAALYPDETFVSEQYLYFCSKDPNTGELHFSKTLQEHEQAVAIYAPLWQAFDESRGL